MQKIVAAKPYRFVPPRHGSFWPSLIPCFLPFYLRTCHGVTSVNCRGTKRLRASIKTGHGIILAPNHCRPCDPMVIGILSGQVRQYLYIMPSWHVFMLNRRYSWFLPRAGVFSVHREGTDRTSIKYAIKVSAKEGQDSDGDSLMKEIREQLTSLLASSLAEFRPGAQMR